MQGSKKETRHPHQSWRQQQPNYNADARRHLKSAIARLASGTQRRQNRAWKHASAAEVIKDSRHSEPTASAHVTTHLTFMANTGPRSAVYAARKSLTRQTRGRSGTRLEDS